MIRASRMIACAAALLSSCFLFSQQPPSHEAVSPAAPPSAAKAKAAEPGKTADRKPRLTADQKLALQLLEMSEAASRGFEAPMRSYGLLQAASSLTGLDAPRARGLLGDAFRATLEIHDDDSTKSRLQEEVFRILLPLSQEDAEELLPQAEMSVRKPITDILVGRYAEKKQFERAQELINQITALDEFPYGSAAKLMDAMPPEMMAEKQGLLSQALSSFKTHEHYKPGLFTAIDSGFTDLIVRFGPHMPPKLALASIDEILSQSKPTAEEEQQTSITVGGEGGIASFRTRYEFELFALLPLLEQLDESRAKHLLEDDQRLQSSLRQYPQGLNSVAPPPKDPNKNRRGLSTQISQGSSGTTRSGYMSEEAFRKAQEIAQEGEADPVQAIAHTMTLPLMLEARTGASPRADALEGIARASVKKNPTAADLALSELRKATADLSLRLQARYLSSAGDLYLQMGEQENAERIVSQGFKVADKLLDQDANPDSPNQALKAWWPSADAYRRFVELQARISHPATFNVLKEIKDPEIRTAESIAFARSLLGLPLNRVLVQVRRKGSDSMSISDTN